MILNVVDTCSNLAIVPILRVIKNILNLVQLIAPILLGIALTITFVKLVVNPEEKKYFKQLKNSIFALLFLFAVPVIINVTMYMLDDSFDLSICWNYSLKEVKLSSKYYDIYESNRNKVTISEKDFEKGEERKEDNNSNNDNNNSTGNTSGPTNSNISRRVFIGDSRTVQLYAYLSGNWNGANYSSGGVHELGKDVIIAQGSMGLSWMKSTGIPAANKYMNNNTAIIILMGVNDLYNLNSYLDYINSNYNNWSNKGCSVYFVSVNPVTGQYVNSIGNKIVSFNSGMKKGLNNNIKYIDSYSHLKSSGYNTTDGLHYNKDTSLKIYNYVIGNL